MARRGWIYESLGEKITLSQVFLILNNPFYYGEFEYPEQSGKWFKGAHQPLISKELFLQVQSSRLIPSKVKYGSKTFAFKGIFKCGSCGSEITVEEKFKLLKDGSLRRHVYYHCTRQVKYDCPEKYVNESDLSAKLLNYIQTNVASIKISEELQRRAARHFEIVIHHFATHQISTDRLHPLVEYAGFVLNKGSYTEQGELVQGIQSTFVIRGREITTT
ncbi:recombinase zinc beta ribbon domain-containing protein [Candidatus Berkelbacteria bacterium]|nr:recombinase zinc beta ribbon domain-containing protein [Candidatus Berkelbacteria bacterium]